MTLRKTEIIEWSTTPAELRRIADEMEKSASGQMILPKNKLAAEKDNMRLIIRFDEGQWQAEQVEGKE